MNILWTEVRTFRYPFPLLLAAFSSFSPLANFCIFSLSAPRSFCYHFFFSFINLSVFQYYFFFFFTSFLWSLTFTYCILPFNHSLFSAVLPLCLSLLISFLPLLLPFPLANLFLSSSPFSQPTTYPPNQQLSLCSSFRNWALYPSFRQSPLPDLHPAFASLLHL